jgi:hypothetical protein
MLLISALTAVTAGSEKKSPPPVTAALSPRRRIAASKGAIAFNVRMSTAMSFCLTPDATSIATFSATSSASATSASAAFMVSPSTSSAVTLGPPGHAMTPSPDSSRP